MINLSGKKGLVVGIANERSIAFGCARAFAEAGAELVATYWKDKDKIFLEQNAAALNIKQILPLDVCSDEQMDAVFYDITQQWNNLDFLLHSLAFAPKADLQGRVVDCSRDGFVKAMDVSVHSFIRMARHAEQLMDNGGTLLTVSYFGGERVIPNYNIMGPVKAALEGTVKYLAAELGSRGIRVNALSPGPILTRAASALADFDELIANTAAKAPEPECLTIADVGATAAFLCSDGARHVTGNISYVDCGYHIMG